MATTVMVPQSAAGTLWTNPSGALLDDTALARYPKGGAANALRLTNLTNRALPGTQTIVGLEIRLDAWAEGLNGSMGWCDRSQNANVNQTLTVTGATHDASLTTYYGDVSVVGTPTALTVIHDLGTPQAVGYIRSKFLFSVHSVPATEYSDDGFTWTPVPRGLFPGPTPGVDMTDDYTLDSVITARYWRFTGADAGGQVRLYNFRLYAADTATERLPVGQTGVQRLEVAITKDGTTAAGAWYPVSLATVQQTFWVGGPTNPLGATQADIASANFGILVRRADALAGENLTTWRALEYGQITVYHYPSGGQLVQERVKAIQLGLIGKESPRGVFATPTRRLKWPIIFQPKIETHKLQFQGDLTEGDHYNITEEAEGTSDGDPCFNEMGVHLASVSKPASASLGSGAFRHEFIINTRALSDFQTYSSEYGDTTAAERVLHAVCQSMSLSTARKENAFSAKYIGQNMQDRSALTPGVAEVQTLTMGSATTQTFRYGGYETGQLATAGLNAAAIQAALQGLTSVGAGNMLVSGTGPFTITAAGALAGKPLPAIEVASFSGGTKPTVDRTTKGGYAEFDSVPMVPSKWDAYYSASLDTLSASKLGMLFTTEFNIDGRVSPYWIQDSAAASWGGAGEGITTFKAKIKVQADANAQAIVSDYRNRAPRFFRLENVGPLIGGGISHRLTIDMSAKVEAYEEFTDADNSIFARSFTLYARREESWGSTIKIVLINTVPSY